MLVTVVFLNSSVRLRAHVLSYTRIVDSRGATLDLHWIYNGGGSLAVREPQTKVTVLEQAYYRTCRRKLVTQEEEV